MVLYVGGTQLSGGKINKLLPKVKLPLNQFLVEVILQRLVEQQLLQVQREVKFM